MIRTVKLQEHLPNFIQEYREMLKIMMAENPEFQLAIDETEVLKNNLFIETCDEKGISRFEDMMGIVPLPSDTLESRISRVLTRWNEALPYTDNFLIRKLNALCGVNNYEIIRRTNKYEMDIITYLELSGQVDELDYLLDCIMPSNILFKVNNKINVNATASANVALGIVYCNTFELTDNFKETMNIEGDVNLANVVTNTIEVNITDNFKETFNIESNVNVASNVSYVENLVIGKE